MHMQDSPERTTLKEIFSQSTDWPEAFQQIQQNAQQGQLPPEYVTVTQAIQQSYQSISTEGRRGLAQLPTDAKVSIVVLAASTARLSFHEGTEEAQQVAQFAANVMKNSAQHGQQQQQGQRVQKLSGSLT